MPAKKKEAVAETQVAEKPKPKKAAAKKDATPEEAAPPVAEKPKPKKAAAKKSARKDDNEDEEAEVASPVADKKLRRESSTGGDSTLMPAAKDLENLSQEEAEKDTVPFDYDACLKQFNSTVFPPASHYKVVSWNVAGLRALIKNGYAKSELKTLIDEEQPDVLCLQETKLSDPNAPLAEADIEGYTFAESLSTAKLGYAGTRTYLKKGVFDEAKTKHFMGFDTIKNPKALDDEGRVVASFLVPAKESAGALPLTIINTYIPNSGMKLERLDYRVADFDKMIRGFLSDVVPSAEKQVYGNTFTTSQIVWLGDLNVAEKNYDRFHNGNYKTMQKTPGFTPPERSSFRETLKAASLADAFRHFYPNHRGAYTFYSRMFNQRAKGNGWRLDYFAVSAAMLSKGRVVGSSILNKYTASDHLPSVLYIKKKL